MIIGQLTGEQPIKTSTGKSIYLNSRWSKKERNIVVKYFEALFKKLDLTFYTHQYKMANPTFAIDLLIEPLKGKNIYTILPATTKSDEFVIIGAHYDTCLLYTSPSPRDS